MTASRPPYYTNRERLLKAILNKLEGNTMTVPNPPFYNSTDDLLYAILQKTNASNTGTPNQVSGFDILYVSSRFGDNTTAQINNPDKPFRTIVEAKLFATSDDIIHVMEGVYSDRNIFGNFRYWFDWGAVVEINSGIVFHNAPGVCTVRGFGRFVGTGNAVPVDVGNFDFAILDMECQSIESNVEGVKIWMNIQKPNIYKPHKIRARKVHSETKAAIQYRFHSHATFDVDEITSNSTTDPALFIGNVQEGIFRNAYIFNPNFAAVQCLGGGAIIRFDNCVIESKSGNANGHGIYTTNLIIAVYMKNTTILCYHPDAKSIYTVSNIWLTIDSNTQVNRDTGGAGIITYARADNRLILENNEEFIDITGSTSINLINCPNAERIWLTSSNPVETINEIINAPRHHNFKLIPANGLKVTLNSTSTISATDSSIILESATLVLNGSRGDWIEFRKGVFGQGNRQIAGANY